MPARNVNIIVLATFLSMLCYFVQRRAKTAMMVGDALEMIDTFYVDPVNADELLIAAMDGMTGKLDEHSEFIPREHYESFQNSINQEFAGIGIFVEKPAEGGPVRVVTPLVGSPALNAGILPGDEIVGVDGQDVSAMELDEVSSRLKGPVGTTVGLRIQRGPEEVAITVRRGRIELESVIGDYRDENNRWVYRLRDDPAIAYIRLTGFGDKTAGELQSVLKELDNDFSAMVLDLRGNGGGLLHAAVDISNMFLENGRIVSTRTRGGKVEDRFEAKRGTLVDIKKPLAILIDGNSASASEILAACLQDHNRAAIVGTRSYGKGTVQNILPLQYGRSALRLTVARYYRPNGKNIHRVKDAGEDDQWGVMPDEGLFVEINEENLIRLAQRWREASYPSLATTDAGSANTGTRNNVEPESSTEATVQATDQIAEPTEIPPTEIPQGNVETEASNLSIDPQLRRAVEHLRKQLTPTRAVAAAA